MEFMLEYTKAGLQELCYGPVLHVRPAGLGSERLLAATLPLPVCCQICPPTLKSRDCMSGQPSLLFKAMVPAEDPKAFSCYKSIIPTAPSCGMAQPHYPHLHAEKPRLREACEDGLGSLLHNQFSTDLSRLIVICSLATV